MQKKIRTIALAAMLCTTAAMANEEIDSSGAEGGNFRHKEEKVYIVPKVLMSSGHTISEEDARVKGENGRGVGLDLGYRTGTGLNFEVDYAYTKVDITEQKGEEKTKTTGDYNSASFDILYAYHINEPLAVFAKTGFEYEKEKIDKLNVDKSDTGFLYGAGFEYEVKENMALLVEYEDSTIDGPKGYTVAVGLVIGLDVLE